MLILGVYSTPVSVEKQTNKQTNKQTDKQTNKQTKRHHFHEKKDRLLYIIRGL